LGKMIPFRPRPRQLQVLDMLYRQKLKRVCILKARQLGFSTLLGIVCLDQLCWSVGRQVSLVDKTQEDARQKLKNIVALAYDSLHAELKARFLVDRANAGEFGVRFHEYDSAQTSTMYAATHARGGSNSLLWISVLFLVVVLQAASSSLAASNQDHACHAPRFRFRSMFSSRL
jgi:hypothetical protein